MCLFCEHLFLKRWGVYRFFLDFTDKCGVALVNSSFFFFFYLYWSSSSSSFFFFEQFMYVIIYRAFSIKGFLLLTFRSPIFIVLALFSGLGFQCTSKMPLI